MASDEHKQRGEITELLNTIEDDSADRLWELVYPELRRRARSMVRGERAGHTLSATAVVNEVFVRLANDNPRQWKDRSHFYAAASGIMRHVLIDHARSRAASKRGGGAAKESLDENLFPAVAADDQGFNAAADALDQLATKHSRAALVVALRVFGGLTVPEVANELKVSERTVKADWMVARIRLREILGELTAQTHQQKRRAGHSRATLPNMVGRIIEIVWSPAEPRRRRAQQGSQ